MNPSKLKELLIKAATTADKKREDSFVSEGNRLYVRFNKIRIHAKPEKIGLFKQTGLSRKYIIDVCLDSDVLKRIEMGPIDFSRGETLTLTGSEGLFEVTFDDSCNG